MRGQRIKERIVKNIDINLYILDHIKRKLQPVAVCPKIKLKQQFEFLCGNSIVNSTQKTKRGSFRNQKVPLTQRVVANKCTRRKLKSQIQRPKKQNEFEYERIEQVDMNMKLRNINDRALQYIKEQKLKNKQILNIKKNKHRTSSEQLCLSQKHPPHHRRIITSRLRPFDFGLLYNQTKCNRILVDKQEKFNLDEQNQNSNTKYGNSYDQSQVFNQRKGKQKENMKEYVKEYERKWINKITKKTINEQTITESQEDKIDLQFKQGLVEEIYDTKRVKFRKKINNTRSRKNIYDGNLYFLKE